MKLLSHTYTLFALSLFLTSCDFKNLTFGRNGASWIGLEGFCSPNIEALSIDYFREEAHFLQCNSITTTYGGATYIHTGMFWDQTTGKYYWLQGDQMMRMAPDGSQKEVLFHHLIRTTSTLAIDGADQKVYWIGYPVGDNVARLERINFDGSGHEVLSTAPEFDRTKNLAVDSVGGFLFWTGAARKIYRSTREGQNITEIVPQIKNYFAIHPPTGMLFYKKGTDILRTDRNGANPTIIATSSRMVNEFIVDPAGTYLYVRQDRERIDRLKLDGRSGFENILQSANTGQSQIFSFGVSGTEIFWSSKDALFASNFSGTQHEIRLYSWFRSMVDTEYDETERKIYFTKGTKVLRFKVDGFDGNGMEQVYDLPLGTHRLKVNPSSGHLFLMEYDGDDVVLLKGHRDGRPLEEIGRKEGRPMGGLDLDPSGEWVYWTVDTTARENDHFLYRTKQDGSVTELVFQPSFYVQQAIITPDSVHFILTETGKFHLFNLQTKELVRVWEEPGTLTNIQRSQKQGKIFFSLIDTDTELGYTYRINKDGSNYQLVMEGRGTIVILD